MLSKLRQCTLLSFEHPSAPILLLTILTYFLYLSQYFSGLDTALCSSMSTLQHQFYLSLNINLFFTEVNLFQIRPVCFAQVWASFRTNFVISSFLKYFYIDWSFARLANEPCIGISIPQHRYCYCLNIMIFLPRLIFYIFGQRALPRCEHPSAPMLFQSNIYLAYII